MSIAALGTLDDGSLDRLRRFNLDVFHKFAPVLPGRIGPVVLVA